MNEGKLNGESYSDMEFKNVVIRHFAKIKRQATSMGKYFLNYHN